MAHSRYPRSDDSREEDYAHSNPESAIQYDVSLLGERPLWLQNPTYHEALASPPASEWPCGIGEYPPSSLQGVWHEDMPLPTLHTGHSVTTVDGINNSHLQPLYRPQPAIAYNQHPIDYPLDPPFQSYHGMTEEQRFSQEDEYHLEEDRTPKPQEFSNLIVTPALHSEQSSYLDPASNSISHVPSESSNTSHLSSTSGSSNKRRRTNGRRTNGRNRSWNGNVLLPPPAITSRPSTQPSLSPYVIDVVSGWRPTHPNRDPTERDIAAMVQLTGATHEVIISMLHDPSQPIAPVDPQSIPYPTAQGPQGSRTCRARTRSTGEWNKPWDQSRPFSCTNKCGNTFVKKGDWIRHEEINCPRSSFQCPLSDCHRQFRRRDKLREHIAKVHQREPNDFNSGLTNTLPDFAFFRLCGFCGKACNSWHDWTDHVGNDFLSGLYAMSAWRDPWSVEGPANHGGSDDGGNDGGDNGDGKSNAPDSSANGSGSGSRGGGSPPGGGHDQTQDPDTSSGGWYFGESYRQLGIDRNHPGAGTSWSHTSRAVNLSQSANSATLPIRSRSIPLQNLDSQRHAMTHASTFPLPQFISFEPPLIKSFLNTEDRMGRLKASGRSWTEEHYAALAELAEDTESIITRLRDPTDSGHSSVSKSVTSQIERSTQPASNQETPLVTSSVESQKPLSASEDVLAGLAITHSSQKAQYDPELASLEDEPGVVEIYHTPGTGTKDEKPGRSSQSGKDGVGVGFLADPHIFGKSQRDAHNVKRFQYAKETVARCLGSSHNAYNAALVMFLEELVVTYHERFAIDIVCVHNLDDDAFNTWAEFRGSPGGTMLSMWASNSAAPDRDQDLVRLLAYRYEPQLHDDQGASLLKFLSLSRQTYPNRPLLFITHSLGGLIVNRALSQAELSDNPYVYGVQKSSIGILLDATLDDYDALTPVNVSAGPTRPTASRFSSYLAHLANRGSISSSRPLSTVSMVIGQAHNLTVGHLFPGFGSHLPITPYIHCDATRNKSLDILLTHKSPLQILKTFNLGGYILTGKHHSIHSDFLNPIIAHLELLQRGYRDISRDEHIHTLQKTIENTRILLSFVRWKLGMVPGFDCGAHKQRIDTELESTETVVLKAQTFVEDVLSKPREHRRPMKVVSVLSNRHMARSHTTEIHQCHQSLNHTLVAISQELGSLQGGRPRCQNAFPEEVGKVAFGHVRANAGLRSEGTSIAFTPTLIEPPIEPPIRMDGRLDGRLD